MLIGLIKGSYGAEAILTAIGEQGDIPEIPHARSREVREAKGVDYAVRVVVATTSIPTQEVCVWAELYHCIGSGSSREGMSMLTRPDEGIYIGE